MKTLWVILLCLFSFSVVAEEKLYEVSTQRYTYYSGALGRFDLEIDLPRCDKKQSMEIWGFLKSIPFIWRKEALQVFGSLIL